MPKFIDLTGQTFGYLTVIKRIETKNTKTRWLCKCKCGKYTTPITYRLLHHKDIPSCGCRRYEPEKLARTHGLSKTRNYSIWLGIKKRCNNPNDSRYEKYGGAGISICDEWNNDYLSFYEWSMNNGYTDDLSIDRIDNSLGYFPDNCRWIPMKEQAKNKTSNIVLTHNGETKTLTDWCKLYGVKPSFALQRHRNLIKNGRTHESITLEELLYNADLNKQPIAQYTKEGVLVKIWESIADAGRNGYCKSSIYRCLNGTMNYHKGFIWKRIKHDISSFKLPEISCLNSSET